MQNPFAQVIVIAIGWVVLILFFILGTWAKSKSMEKRKRETIERTDAEMNARAKVIAEGRPVIRHEIPEDAELAAYMQDLPREIKTITDAQRLAMKLEQNAITGLWQSAISGVIAILLPHERVYSFMWNARCVAMGRGDSQNDALESHGVVFFSNMRFLHYRSPWEIIEFPLNKIYTVEAHKGYYFDGISFFTPDLHVQLTFAGAIDRKLFRDMIIHIAASAVCPILSSGAVYVSTMVCECPGCGATVIIHENVRNRCDFCNRLVEKRDLPPKKITNSVADEINKYKELLDKGAISEKEYEKAKESLLGKL